MRKLIVLIWIAVGPTALAVIIHERTGLQRASYLFSKIFSQTAGESNLHKLEIPYDERAFEALKSEAHAVMLCGQQSEQGMDDEGLSKCLIKASGLVSDAVWKARLESTRPSFQCPQGAAESETLIKPVPPAAPAAPAGGVRVPVGPG